MKRSYVIRTGESQDRWNLNTIEDIDTAREEARLLSSRSGEPVNLYLATETLVETIGTWTDKRR